MMPWVGLFMDEILPIIAVFALCFLMVFILILIEIWIENRIKRGIIDAHNEILKLQKDADAVEKEDGEQDG